MQKPQRCPLPKAVPVKQKARQVLCQYFLKTGREAVTGRTEIRANHFCGRIRPVIVLQVGSPDASQIILTMATFDREIETPLARVSFAVGFLPDTDTTKIENLGIGK